MVPPIESAALESQYAKLSALHNNIQGGTTMNTYIVESSQARAQMSVSRLGHGQLWDFNQTRLRAV